MDIRLTKQTTSFSTTSNGVWKKYTKYQQKSRNWPKCEKIQPQGEKVVIFARRCSHLLFLSLPNQVEFIVE